MGVMDKRPVGVATSREDSYRLVRAGLDPDSADMFWDFHTGAIGNTIDDKYTLETGKYAYLADIPAWSMGALMRMLPSNIQVWPWMIDSRGFVQQEGIDTHKVFRRGISNDIPERLIQNLVDEVLWLMSKGFLNTKYLRSTKNLPEYQEEELQRQMKQWEELKAVSEFVINMKEEVI